MQTQPLNRLHGDSIPGSRLMPVAHISTINIPWQSHLTAMGLDEGLDMAPPANPCLVMRERWERQTCHVCDQHHEHIVWGLGIRRG